MVTLVLIAGGLISIKCGTIVSIQDNYPGTTVVYETALTKEKEVLVAGGVYHVKNKIERECNRQR